MTDYLVRWEIDIEADSADEAARKARHYQTKPDSSATVFDVRDPTGLVTRIDVAHTFLDRMTRVTVTGCTEDGTPLRCTLAELFDTPEDFGAKEQAEIRACLARGETYRGGGGAAPLFTIEKE